MRYRSFASGLIACAAVSIASAGPNSSSAANIRVDFRKQIQPIFATHCIKCHGPKKQEGGLRLDHRVSALRGGDSGKVLIPNKSAASEIVKRITSKDASTRMPPAEKGNKPLSPVEIAFIKKWIDGGAIWPADGEKLKVKTDHWAYQPVKDDAPPKLKDAAAKQWMRNAIDAFVLAKLRKHNLQPSEPADRYTLIKRLYYDLIGLPPGPKDVDAFVKDKSPRAYEKLVDRLLASQHFGERWGRHWLDKARYADSDGYEKDRPRLNAWRYRDWVIDAINRDLPFDEFTRQQLAGDLLPNANEMTKLATAFHRQTLTNTEGGTDKEQFRVEAIFDRVATTGTVWLGLTVGCAQCHSHKYDPLTQAEYYQLFAFFNNGDETTIRIPHTPAAVARYNKAKAAHDKRLRDLEDKLSAVRRKLAPQLPAWEQKLRAKRAKQGEDRILYNEIAFTKLKQTAIGTIRLRENSFLVSGKNPDADVYTLAAKTDVGKITGFRLDALTHKSLGGNGPGRTAHGNFVLSRFRVFVVAPDGKQREVKLIAARADFSQKAFPPNGALLPKPKTGWAISPQMGKPHWIEFRTETPLILAKDEALKFVIAQNYGGKHTIGRFRLRAMTGGWTRPTLPAAVRAALKTPAEQRTAKQSATLLHHFALKNSGYKKLNSQLAALKKKAPKPAMMNVRVISQRKSSPRKTHVLRRGDFLQPQAEIQPDAPAVLHDLKARRSNPAGPDRLDLANWLMHPDNPLTSRVAVNHIWSHLFGHGIVRTINDFGVRGEKPSHPLLLDWLAKEYMSVGRTSKSAARDTADLEVRSTKAWSRKAMIKLIVMSATYRQSSQLTQSRTPRVRSGPGLTEPGSLRAIDPENRLLSRQNRFRVEAEIVRDIYLEASGLLSKKVGGPSVFPPMPPDVAALSYAGNFKWNTSKGPDRYRRGMYTFFKRTAPHPTLMTFDCPDSNTTNVKRRTSNTPLMALTTLNNMVFVEASRSLAKRVLTEAGLKSDVDRISRAIRLCVARPPTSKERAAFHELLTASRKWYVGHPKDAAKLVGSYQPKDVAPAEAAAWVATCRIVMNLDEFLTRE